LRRGVGRLCLARKHAAAHTFNPQSIYAVGLISWMKYVHCGLGVC